MKGLIIDEPWISLIIAGEKTWEMRSRNTLVRGRIALIRKGSKAVVGVAELSDTLPRLSVAELKASYTKHQVPLHEIGADFKWATAWVLTNAKPLRDSVPYRHPSGAVIWINLEPEVARMIDQQIAPA